MILRLPVLSGTIAPHDATETSRAAPEGRLTIGEWLRFGPFLAQLVVTRRCNLSCGYCNEYDDHSAPVPFATLDERLLKLRDLRTWVVCLTGGEPTLHPELVRIVARMRELRFRRRQLITNGYLLTPKLIEALNDAGLTDLQISVDGVKRNAVTVKVLDPLRIKLLALSRRARFQVVVSAVIGSARPEEALAVVRFARAHGLVPRIILLHDGSGRLNLSAEELATYREVKRLLGRGGREAADYREDLIERGRAPFVVAPVRGTSTWTSPARSRGAVRRGRHSSATSPRTRSTICGSSSTPRSHAATAARSVVSAPPRPTTAGERRQGDARSVTNGARSPAPCDFRPFHRRAAARSP
jgi:pyruvate-formate lyase-activating enzyme